MALKKNLIWVSSFLLISMLILVPFVQSSRTSFQGRTTVSRGTAMATQLRFGKGSGSVSGSGSGLISADEDSAREVPTGPDPLHHNDNPAGP